MQTRPFLGLAAASALLIAGPVHAAVVTQNAGDSFVAFEAESPDTITNSGALGWVRVSSDSPLVYTNASHTTTILPADTNASGNAGLMVTMGVGNEAGVATYRLVFANAGTYRVYARYSSFDLTTGGGAVYAPDGNYGNEDSFYIATQWNVGSIVSSGGGQNVVQAGAASFTEGTFGWQNTGVNLTVTPAQVGQELVFTIATRERGQTLDRFVLSTSTGLVAANLDALANSPIPEPASFTGLALLGAAALTRRR